MHQRSEDNMLESVFSPSSRRILGVTLRSPGFATSALTGCPTLPAPSEESCPSPIPLRHGHAAIDASVHQETGELLANIISPFRCAGDLPRTGGLA